MSSIKQQTNTEVVDPSAQQSTEQQQQSSRRSSSDPLFQDETPLPLPTTIDSAAPTTDESLSTRKASTSAGFSSGHSEPEHGRISQNDPDTFPELKDRQEEYNHQQREDKNNQAVSNQRYEQASAVVHIHPEEEEEEVENEKDDQTGQCCFLCSKPSDGSYIFYDEFDKVEVVNTLASKGVVLRSDERYLARVTEDSRLQGTLRNSYEGGDEQPHPNPGGSSVQSSLTSRFGSFSQELLSRSDASLTSLQERKELSRKRKVKREAAAKKSQLAQQGNKKAEFDEMGSLPSDRDDERRSSSGGLSSGASAYLDSDDDELFLEDDEEWQGCAFASKWFGLVYRRQDVEGFFIQFSTQHRGAAFYIGLSSLIIVAFTLSNPTSIQRVFGSFTAATVLHIIALFLLVVSLVYYLYLKTTKEIASRRAQKAEWAIFLCLLLYSLSVSISLSETPVRCTAENGQEGTQYCGRDLPSELFVVSVVLLGVGPRFYWKLGTIVFYYATFAILFFLNGWDFQGGWEAGRRLQEGNDRGFEYDANLTYAERRWKFNFVLFPVQLLLIQLVILMLRERLQRSVFEVSLYLAQYERDLNLYVDVINGFLTTLLPPQVLDRVLDGGAVVDSQVATILHSNIVGFSSWCASRRPRAILEMLRTVVEEFDRLGREYQCLRMKTLGDTYMAACGIPTAYNSVEQDGQVISHCDSAILFAYRLHSLVTLLCQQRVHDFMNGPGSVTNNKNSSSKFSVGNHSDAMNDSQREGFYATWGELKLRIGVHTGFAVGAMTSARRWTYELFGPVPKLAQDLEEKCATSGTIAISPAAFRATSLDFVKMKAKKTDYHQLAMDPNATNGAAHTAESCASSAPAEVEKNEGGNQSAAAAVGYVLPYFSNMGSIPLNRTFEEERKMNGDELEDNNESPKHQRNNTRLERQHSENKQSDGEGIATDNAAALVNLDLASFAEDGDPTQLATTTTLAPSNSKQPELVALPLSLSPKDQSDTFSPLPQRGSNGEKVTGEMLRTRLMEVVRAALSLDAQRLETNNRRRVSGRKESSTTEGDRQFENEEVDVAPPMNYLNGLSGISVPTLGKQQPKEAATTSLSGSTTAATPPLFENGTGPDSQDSPQTTTVPMEEGKLETSPPPAVSQQQIKEDMAFRDTLSTIRAVLITNAVFLAGYFELMALDRDYLGWMMLVFVVEIIVMLLFALHFARDWRKARYHALVIIATSSVVLSIISVASKERFFARFFLLQATFHSMFCAILPVARSMAFVAMAVIWIPAALGQGFVGVEDTSEVFFGLLVIAAILYATWSIQKDFLLWNSAAQKIEEAIYSSYQELLFLEGVLKLKFPSHVIGPLITRYRINRAGGGDFGFELDGVAVALVHFDWMSGGSSASMQTSLREDASTNKGAALPSSSYTKFTRAKELVESFAMTSQTLDALLTEWAEMPNNTRSKYRAGGLPGCHIDKVKSLGDTVLLASGLDTPDDHTNLWFRRGRARSLKKQKRASCFDVVEFLAVLQKRLIHLGTKLIAALHVGSVTAAVIGKRQIEYDIFGPTVSKTQRVLSSMYAKHYSSTLATQGEESGGVMHQISDTHPPVENEIHQHSVVSGENEWESDRMSMNSLFSNPAFDDEASRGDGGIILPRAIHGRPPLSARVEEKTAATAETEEVRAVGPATQSSPPMLANIRCTEDFLRIIFGLGFNELAFEESSTSQKAAVAEEKQPVQNPLKTQVPASQVGDDEEDEFEQFQREEEEARYREAEEARLEELRQLRENEEQRRDRELLLKELENNEGGHEHSHGSPEEMLPEEETKRGADSSSRFTVGCCNVEIINKKSGDAAGADHLIGDMVLYNLQLEWNDAVSSSQAKTALSEKSSSRTKSRSTVEKRRKRRHF